jgi:hypothetical protein
MKPGSPIKPHFQLEIAAPADLPIWRIFPSTRGHCSAAVRGEFVLLSAPLSMRVGSVGHDSSATILGLAIGVAGKKIRHLGLNRAREERLSGSS